MILAKAREIWRLMWKVRVSYMPLTTIGDLKNSRVVYT